MTKTKAAAAAVILTALLAGCGSYAAANDYNLPNQMAVERGHATRIETPGNFPSVVRVCERNGTGIYVAQDQGSAVTVVHHDSDCAP